MSKYGLEHQDLMNVRKKIKTQEDYLENNSFTTSEGQVKSLLDLSYSANLSTRYYPRILNKVNTFVSVALNQDLVPVFLTVTLDGFFRDFIKGDYSRFTNEVREKYKKHIPNNDRSGYYMDYIDQKQKLTPKDLYKILGYQLHRFTKSESLRNIKKNDFNYSYIRVTEPHKDGVPHFHILLYVPECFVPKVYEDFVRFFPAPQNHKKLSLKNSSGENKRNGAKIGDKYFETLGFQTQINSATSYILKYILKSFTNLIEDKEVDYLQAWYIHNRIPRLITTHTLVSQDIYSKVSPLESDWYYLSNLKLDGRYTKDSLNNSFEFLDALGRRIIGDNGYFIIENGGRIVAQYGKKKIHVPKYRLRSLKFTVDKSDKFNPLHIYSIWIQPKQYSYYIKKSYKEDNSCGSISYWKNSQEQSSYLY